MAKLLTQCPVCEGTLGVTELTCTRCRTQIRGLFATCRFCRLSPEHLGFVELFLRCEGNLSRVEKELSLSYPTVRNKLSAALAALGFVNGEDRHETPEPASSPAALSPEGSARRLEILEAVSGGELSAEEAALALRDLS